MHRQTAVGAVQADGALREAAHTERHAFSQTKQLMARVQDFLPKKNCSAPNIFYASSKIYDHLQARRGAAEA